MIYPSLTDISLCVLFCVFITWTVKFHWRRRKINENVRKIPGPRGYPLVGNSFDFLENSTEKIFQKVLHYFDTNPEIYKFWIGSKLIVGVSKPDALEVIFNHKHCLEKDPLIDVMKPLTGNGLFSAPVAIWKKHRKIMNGFFKQKNLESFCPFMNDTCKKLLDVLDKNVGNESLDIFEKFNNCNISFMTEIALGYKPTSDTEFEAYGKWLDKLLPVLLLRMTNVFLRINFLFRLTRYKSIHDEMLSNINDFFMKAIMKKKAEFLNEHESKQNNDRGEEYDGSIPVKNVLDMLLHLPDEENKLTTEEIKDELSNFLAGSTETTATTMSFCSILLGMHPQIQQQVYEEIMNTVGPADDITADHLPRLKCLENCILETMRIFPLAPMLLRLSTADIELENFTIPKNTTILTCQMHNHRSPKYWEDPLKFDPGRFTPEETAKRHPYLFLPFSAGPRACVGLKLAMISMKIVLCNVLRKFVLKTKYASVEEVDLKGHIVLRPVKGYRVFIESRN